MNAITTYRPGLLGHKVINEVFDSFFSDFPTHLRASTQGYPVADIYRDDDGSTILEFALAGFKRKGLPLTSSQIKDQLLSQDKWMRTMRSASALLVETSRELT